MRARLARAFATRAEAARRKSPNAKLGFYGTLLADSRGRATAVYLARIEALVEVGERGLFDEIDFLVPVIYPRFGPNDNANAWGSYEAVHAQGDRRLEADTQVGREQPSAAGVPWRLLADRRPYAIERRGVAFGIGSWSRRNARPRACG
jgi:hypothetical protein